MKTRTPQTLLPALLLGGLLLTPGCSTPTVTVGAAPKSDRVVLHISSAIPSRVQCVWLQSGASIEHVGTTPLRLIFPASAVHKLALFKATKAADVVVEIRPPGAEPNRLVMHQGTSAMELMRNGRGWEGRVF
jgi:hypothetical protein